ncbi:bacterial regulatory s, gntR family protein [Desulfovibrio sp. A2]|nr:bacterial regulatory s, gntR family protein [Desulfovibrio sp. A2]
MLHLDAASHVPLYQQICDQLKHDILSGALPQGMRLPSIRALSRDLRAGKNTVENAYAQLVLEGYVSVLPRSGYRVNLIQRDLHAPASPAAGGGGKAGRGDAANPSRPARYDFHYGNLDAATFPYAVWRKLLFTVMEEARTGRAASDGMHVYGDAHGDLHLRGELAAYLYRSRGVRCTPDQVVMCSGLQPSIMAVTRLLLCGHGPEHGAVSTVPPFAPVAQVALEDPAYNGARRAYECFGFRTIPIPVNKDGIDVAALRASSARVVHIAPSHQFPTGAVMPIGRRMEILNWAAEHGAWIVEDDYDSELRYDGRPIPSLQSIDRHGRVIYTGTFSKTLSPGMRMSYMVLPEGLVERFRAVFAGFQCTVPWLEQAVLARFMAEGHWERHLRRICQAKKRKHDVFVGTAARLLGERIRIRGHNAGLHLLLEVPGGPGEAALVELAAAHGVRVYPASPFWADARRYPGNCLFIGYGMLSEADIAAALEQLRQAWFPASAFRG